LKPFAPPHFDAVTSLGVLGDTIVSGSRDKILRSWDPLSGSEKYPYIKAHHDWINAIQSKRINVINS
jgi:WD40 repeat protein